MTNTGAEVRVGMPEADYHQHPAVSKSDIDQLLITPYHYYDRRANPQRYEGEGTVSMATGSALHCAVLEPSQLYQRYHFKSKAGEKAEDGLIGLTVKQGQHVMGMAGGVFNTKFYEKQLAPYTDNADHCEVSIFWTDTETGVACRCRPDFLRIDGQTAWCVDIKQSVDASADGFSRAVANYNYHRQAAHYSSGVQAAFPDVDEVIFVFLVVDSTPPYLSRPRRIPDDAVQIGHEQCRTGLSIFKTCVEKKYWPGYGDEIETSVLPNWFYYKN